MGRGASDPAATVGGPANTTAGRSLLASTTTGLTATAADGQQQLAYRGKPLQLSRSRRFAWDYEIPADRPQSSRLRVELWSTRDAGVSWQKTAVDDDTQSPINVVLPASGLYGFRLEIVPDLPDNSAGPRPGDPAESWIGVDEDAPHVELLGVTRTSQGEGAGLMIRYTSRDQLPAPKTTRLLFSPSPEGPWATIATGLDNQGEYLWEPDRAAPARAYLRVEASDAAGNVGAATSAEPITVVTSRTVGRLGGLRALPTTP